ncbi:radical SAM protein [Chthonobacter albigriseus]|uniref:radical SAM protein n=1 Tax=Chthonobacter albigriseus TaxID=1683161 RepID=UPI0015EF06D4|nr:radical SAM protein [Chthonobacter albigriseus]
MSAPFPRPTRISLAEQAALNSRYESFARDGRLLPIKVTAFYRAKIDAEVAALGHTEGPLHRGVYPSRERFSVAAGHEVADWVDDRANMPVTGSQTIIHKYPDRVLFMPTSVCAAHCQYCFRQDVLTDQHGEGRTDVQRELAALTRYLDGKRGVSEVILSGGDPMTLPLRDLSLILRTLREIPQIRSLRIHSRTLAFAPKVFADPAKVALLAETGVRLVLHFIHPYEICGEVEAVLRLLRRSGIRLYNHFPLLRGINDHVSVIAALIEKLDELSVRTLSIYVPEPIRHSAPYRVPLKRIFAIQDSLTQSTPSWVNAIRFTLDSPLGKVRREQISKWDEARGLVTFRREGREIVYPDFPAALDVPGDPSIMLWKEATPAAP